MSDLGKQQADGKISREEFENKAKELADEHIKKNQELNPDRVVNEIPDWVKKLGFVEPKGLEFDKLHSQKSKETITLDYVSNDYDKALKEAEKIAKSLDIQEAKISPRKQVEKLLKVLPTQEAKDEMRENMKGAMFTNCEHGSCKELKYSKMVNLNKNENGKWTVEVIIIDLKKANLK